MEEIKVPELKIVHDRRCCENEYLTREHKSIIKNQEVLYTLLSKIAEKLNLKVVVVKPKVIVEGDEES